MQQARYPYKIKTMSSTVFERIVSREIPAHIVFEDEKILAFLDIAPVNKGHVLVIPKMPFPQFHDITGEYLIPLVRAVQIIAPALLRATHAPAYNIIMNNGQQAGQVVEHAHIHIIPRFDTTELGRLPHKTYASGEMESLAEYIKHSISTGLHWGGV